MGILNTLHAMSHGLDRYKPGKKSPVVTIELDRSSAIELCAKLTHELKGTSFVEATAYGESFRRVISPGECFELYGIKIRIIERA